MGWREIKREMRRDLHGEMRVPAMLITADFEEGLLVYVRLHYRIELGGEISGGDAGYALRYDLISSILFMLDEPAELPVLSKNMVISFQTGVAFNVDTVQPKDDITQKVDVTRLSVAKTTGLPVPPEDA